MFDVIWELPIRAAANLIMRYTKLNRLCKTMDPRRLRHDIGRSTPRPQQSVDGFLPPSRSLPPVRARIPAAKVVPRRPIEPIQRPVPPRPAAPVASHPAPIKQQPAAISLPQRNWETLSQPSAKRRPLRWRYVMVPLACLGLAVLSFIIWQHRSGAEVASVQNKVDTPTSQAKKLTTVVPATLPTTDGLATYKAAIQAVFDANPDIRATVITVNLKTGQKVQLGSTEPYTAASTAKLLTAVTYFLQVEKGAASLDKIMSNGQSAQYNLQQMIVLSDNDCWTVLNKYLTHAKLSAEATAIGMTAYDPDNNVLAANDTALLLQQLYDGKLINQANREMLLGWMEKANYRENIVAAVPAGYTVYHKVGILDDLLHDAAIITKGDEALELVIYTDGGGTYESDAQVNMMHSITTAALAAYFKAETTN